MFNHEVPLRIMLGVWCAVNIIKIIDAIFWEHKCSLICHIYTDTIAVRWSDGGRIYSINFPNIKAQQLTAQTVLCVLTLFVDDNSKQEIMAPSFSRPDPVNFLRACVWNDKMYSEVSRTEVNQNERIQDITSPISPAELRLTINNAF
jgi:broad specificity polyphosphatase/5'/3'-nucleotidase SurE